MTNLVKGAPVHGPQLNGGGRHNGGRPRGGEQQGCVSKHPAWLLVDLDLATLNLHDQVASRVINICAARSGQAKSVLLTLAKGAAGQCVHTHNQASGES